MAKRESDDRLTSAVRALAAPLVAGAGATLEDVRVHGPRDGRTVQLTIDHDDGVGIDLVAAITRDVSGALDDEDVVPGSYTLEVTSPGVDRPLRSVRDFTRNVGRDVRLQLTPDRPDKLPGEVTGRIADVEGDVAAGEDVTVVLNIKGRPKRVALAHIDHGKVVLPW